MKYNDRIQEFLDSELGEIPFFEGYSFKMVEEYNGWEFYSVTIRDTEFSYLFRINDKALQVDMHEDTWEDCEFYNWNVKYFWMSILDWNF